MLIGSPESRVQSPESRVQGPVQILYYALNKLLFQDQCTLSVMSVRSPQSLSTIYISCSMTLKREISRIKNFRFPYANQFVKRCEEKIIGKQHAWLSLSFTKLKLKDGNIRQGCFYWRLINLFHFFLIILNHA